MHLTLKKWMSDDLKFIGSIISITLMGAGLYYGIWLSINEVKSDVRQIGTKLDDLTAYVKEDHQSITVITANDNIRDNRLTAVETKLNVKAFPIFR